MTLPDTSSIPGRYTAVHTLRTFAGVNLNADENGEPKTLQYGDALRMRISSQSKKRAMRTWIVERINRDAVATRTKQLPAIIANRLTDHTDEPVMVACALLRGAGFTIKAASPHITEEQVFMPRSAADALADAAVKHLDVLRPHADAITEQVRNATEADKPRRRSTSPGQKKEAKLAAVTLPAEVQRDVWDALAPGSSIEIALGGRMLTALPDDERHIPGAMSVAHAYSVDPIQYTTDAWSAVDDWDAWGDGGFTTTSHIATGTDAQRLGSGTVYEWASFDRQQFRDNIARGLPDDRAAEATATGEALFVEAAIRAVPKGHRTSTGSQVLPEAVLVTVTDEPAPTAPCFTTAVTGSDVVAQAAQRLASYTGRTQILTPANGGYFLWLPGIESPAPTFPDTIKVL